MSRAPTSSRPASPPAPSLLPPRAALAILAFACALLWADVLFGGRVLLPGGLLRGFAPFGGDLKAPWTILQWDALAQYFPWRSFAAQQLHAGRLPLWNPHQFSGAPFVANGQSAVFYIGSVPFWLGDVRGAFGIAAFAHSLLAALGAFALLRHWKLSQAASIFGALAWAGSGYLAAWSALPTLANTASWLPLLLWLFERAASHNETPVRESKLIPLAVFALALCSALLAGHAQIFAFVIVALLWRALTVESPLRALRTLASGGTWAALLGALQLLPTLELARLGHRAGAEPSVAGWSDIAAHALQPAELLAVAAPGWPMRWQSLNENFPYIGATALLLALAGAALAISRRRFRSPQAFALGLCVLGLGTALAWPPARWIYFGVPGAAQFAGLGRALVLWSLGAALLGAFGLDALGRRFPQRAPIVALLACLLLAMELGLNSWSGRATAGRQEIYPRTALTDWLHQNRKGGERVLFVTPRSDWAPAEAFANSNRSHPRGVLPPNGAMAYGLDDVGGYDSLSPAAYREYLNAGEGRDVAAPFNGNMALPGALNAHLDELGVRYIVALSGEPSGISLAARAFEGNGCVVWERDLKSGARRSGLDFSPGVRDGRYQPQSFRLGAFLSLCALGAIGAAGAWRWKRVS